MFNLIRKNRDRSGGSLESEVKELIKLEGGSEEEVGEKED